jgi:lactate dehydrogenase-like 2-hydroxyacid dehydrogenase
MVGGNISSEKIDLLVYGPNKPIIDKGFSDQFVLHPFESRADLDRLNPAVAAKIRGAAVTYSTVRCDGAMMALFPKLEIVASFGVGYDHVDANHAREHNIVVTNTPDVLTEEVADVAMGLLIATLREFVKADRYLRSGHWLTQQFPLSVGSLRDRTVGIVGMGRIGQAIGRRLEASRLPFSQSGCRRFVQALPRSGRDGESGRYAGGDCSRRSGDGENDQRRCHEGARTTGRDHQRGARFGR